MLKCVVQYLMLIIKQLQIKKSIVPGLKIYLLSKPEWEGSPPLCIHLARLRPMRMRGRIN